MQEKKNTSGLIARFYSIQSNKQKKIPFSKFSFALDIACGKSPMFLIFLFFPVYPH